MTTKASTTKKRSRAKSTAKNEVNGKKTIRTSNSELTIG